MSQEPERVDTMTGEPLEVQSNTVDLEKDIPAEFEIPYVEEDSSGTFKKKLLGFGMAAVLVAGLCIFLLFFFRPTDTEYILSAMEHTFEESGKEFCIAGVKDIFDDSVQAGKYMLELKTNDENLSRLGFYVDAGKKQFLTEAEGGGQAFQFYLDDEEVSIGTPEELIFLNFSEIRSKLRDCPLAKEAAAEFKEEDIEKADKVLKEVRALFWETFSSSPLDNEEQKKSFKEFREKISVEKKGKKELSLKDGTVSCTIYQLSIEMDDLTDFLCEILNNSMLSDNEHVKNIISTVSEKDVEKQFEDVKKQMSDGLREEMEEMKREYGDKLFFDTYINSEKKLAGVSFEWKIQEEPVNMEFLCPSGNIAREAELIISEGSSRIVISNEGETIDGVFCGKIRTEIPEEGDVEILSYEYNQTNGEFTITSGGDREDVLRGKFYADKEKEQIEMEFYPGGEEISILFKKMEGRIEKPCGKRHNLLEETRESLSETGILSKYSGSPYDTYEVEGFEEETFDFEEYDTEDLK